MTTPDVERLRRVPLFADLDSPAIQRVAALATEFQAPSGHILMERGQAGTGIFIIEEGSVTVELPHDDDVTLGPGEFVGELSVLADTPRSARVCVEDDLRAVAIRRSDLDALLEEEPSIALAMLRGVARRFAGHL